MWSLEPLETRGVFAKNRIPDVLFVVGNIKLERMMNKEVTSKRKK
jgi:hypothetical protein